MNIVTRGQLLANPVCMMTLLQNISQGTAKVSAEVTPEYKEKSYAYGISGIADIFGCSILTADRIKKSGDVDQAITQVEWQIIVDAKMAVELAKKGLCRWRFL